MNKICTSIEQSKKLIELGLDVKTADMFWDTLFAKKPEAQVNNHYFIDEYDDEHRVPAWSLAALLDVLPDPDLFYNDGWNLYVTVNDKIININYVDNPIDACYEIIIKLKDKKLL